MRRLRTLVALPLVLAALAGCGDGAPGEEAQVRGVLSDFATAVEKRDYQTLCDDVFAPELLDGLKAIGLPCEVAMRNSLGEVKEAKLTVGKVTVKGAQADAEIKTSAAGQAPSADTIRLKKLSGAWKVSALSAPTPTATATPTSTPTARPSGYR